MAGKMQEILLVIRKILAKQGRASPRPSSLKGGASSFLLSLRQCQISHSAIRNVRAPEEGITTLLPLLTSVQSSFATF
jgi:hypothetical protein